MNFSASFVDATPSPWGFHLVFLLVLAPFVGSFLGLITVRLPQDRPLVWSRSACDHCGHRLGIRDLVPILSWLLLGRQCRYCAKPIPARYPLIELAAFGAALWSVLVVPGWLAWATAGLGWALLTLAVIDSDHYLLPDEITLPLIPAGLAVAWGVDSSQILSHVVGALIGFLLLWGLRWLYQRLRGREGLGLGDAKLLCAAGAWVSWEGLPSVILFAAGAGLLFQVLRRLRGQRPTANDRVPFGPYLAAGLWLVWLYGPLQIAL